MSKSSEDSKAGSSKAQESQDGDGEVAALKRERQKALEETRKKQNAETAAAGRGQQQQRLNFLLQQSELFSHFIDGAGHHAEPATPQKKSRKSAKEEDEDLLQTALHDRGSGFHFDKTPPYIQGGTMRDYQVAGLNWLIRLYENAINGILADEMGLGKTLQTISFLGYLKHIRNVKGPHMVIVPKSTLPGWIREFARWCPSLKVVKLHGSQEERAAQLETMGPGEFEVCVTTNEIAIREKAALKKFNWHYLIVDEAHRIKNENSVLSQVLRIYESNNRLLITGTPLQNNLHELWALLNFLLPDIFGNAGDFDSWFDITSDNQHEIADKLHKVLRPFLLRRLKTDVEKSLPPKKEVKLFVGLSQMQKEWYKKLLVKDLDSINGMIGGKKEGHVRLLNIVMQLRKACNHPYLFDGAEKVDAKTGLYTTDDHLVENSGKMTVLHKLLKRLKAVGSRVLIFSQMTRLLDILEDYMLWQGHEYCRIDGSTSAEEREQGMDAFNQEGSSKFVFLLSTRSGGLGINLATADTVILYDSDWNPQMDLQAQDRAHRIGQKKPVTVYRFVTQGTIEEKIVERAEMKLHLDALVIQQGRLMQANKGLSKDEMLSMIKYGADAIFASKDSTITDEDIDALLRIGEQKSLEISEKIKANSNSLLNNASFKLDDPDFSLYMYEGQDYSKKKLDAKEAALATWIAPPRRERKEDYRDVIYVRPAAPKKPKELIPPRQPACHDFQFYPAALQGYLKREMAAFEKRLKFLQERENNGTGEPSEKEEGDWGDLTDKERSEKERLQEQGFVSWGRKDFQAFVRGCERYGRANLEKVAEEVGKPVKEVTDYSKVFWRRYKELSDYERILGTIEKGEARIQRFGEMETLLSNTISAYENPLFQLKIPYGQKSGPFTEEEDRFLLFMANKLGYGKWDELKMEVRRSPLFCFDWYIKSRKPAELARRVEQLLRLIEKEAEKVPKKRGATPKASSAPKRQKVAAPKAAKAKGARK